MKEKLTNIVGLGRKQDEAPAMKLAVAIVQDEDADPVIKELIQAGLSVTKIGSTGGFLRHGNATLLIAVEAGRVDTAVDILRAQCQTREVPISASIEDKATVGGAVVAVLDIEQFLRC